MINMLSEDVPPLCYQMKVGSSGHEIRLEVKIVDGQVSTTWTHE